MALTGQERSEDPHKWAFGDVPGCAFEVVPTNLPPNLAKSFQKTW